MYSPCEKIQAAICQKYPDNISMMNNLEKKDCATLRKHGESYSVEH